MPETLFEKVWRAHAVAEGPGLPTVLYIDLHLIHEVSSPQAFDLLRERGLQVRRPDRSVATMDHATPTTSLDLSYALPLAARQIEVLARNCAEFGIQLYGLDSDQRGIVHVLGPELGLTQPGMTIVCGDSHTSTHGAFGALAFGIGTSEVGHVLATQCLLQSKPGTFAVNFEGRPGPGVTAKDYILALLAKQGTGAGAGYVFEYRGEAIRALEMEARMTICNMSIEGGARAGMIAPDDRTFEYMAGRPYAPGAADWDRALRRWRALASDEGASFDRETTIDVGRLEPMITYGTNPGMGSGISGRVPDPAQETDSARRASLEKSLGYMGLQPGQPLIGQPVQQVFIGSCTNARISDLREAARLLDGRRAAEGVRLIVVPGSQGVKRQAEAEGLDRIFREAGAEWRESGCSLCVAMNGDIIEPGQVAISTSNRNFEGRQGPGARTLLASPLTAAASALTGVVTDPRTMMG